MDTENIDINSKVKWKAKLEAECEAAKIILTAAQQTELVLELGEDGFTIEITRSTFEDLNRKNFARSIEVIDETLKQAKMKPSDINEIVMVGGTSRIPKIKELV